MAEFETSSDNLIHNFKLERLLRIANGGRSVSLYGSVSDKPAIVIVDRAAFTITDDALKYITSSAGLGLIKVLGQNDVYNWYLASSIPTKDAESDLKIQVIYPCTEAHIRKHSTQGFRVVRETPEIYREKTRPFIEREKRKLKWVDNILEGRTEVERVVSREEGEEGFVILPDLNWDQKTMSALHLLALVIRRDIWSIRDLKKKHVLWLKHMRDKLIAATVKKYPELSPNQIKLYIHYFPTYFHLHIHIANVAHDPDRGQSVGKALGLDNLIFQLEGMAGDEETGFADVGLMAVVGEESELWTEIFANISN